MIEAHRTTGDPVNLLVDPGSPLPDLDSSLLGAIHRLEAAVGNVERSLASQREQLASFQGACRESLFEIQDALDLLSPGPAEVVEMRRDITAKVGPKLAGGSIVLVVGKGATYLRAPHLRVWNFPCGSDGRYRGYYPGDDLSALAHLEALRGRGARYLVIPAPSQWWLTQYPRLAHDLRLRFQLVHDDSLATVFDLDRPDQGPEDLSSLIEQVRSAADRDPAVLDLTGLGLGAALPSEQVFAPPRKTCTLPYLDQTIDVVVVADGDHNLLSEAERVASLAVIRVLEQASGATDYALDWSGSATTALPGVHLVLIAGDGSSPAFDEHRRREVSGDAAVLGASVIVASLADSPGAVAATDPPFSGAGSIVELLAALAGEHPDGLIVVVAPGVVPLAGSLLALVRLLVRRTDAAIACGRVLDEEGTLISAGGIRGVTGPACWIGAGDPRPDSEAYSYTRSIDAVSEEIFAVRASLIMAVEPSTAPHRVLEALVGAARERGACALYEPDCAAVVAQPAVRPS